MSEKYYSNLGAALADMGSVDQGSYHYNEQMGPVVPGTETDVIRADAADAEARWDQEQFEKRQAEAAALQPTPKQQMINTAILILVAGLVIWYLASQKTSEALEA